MRLTKQRLREIIKEELVLFSEARPSWQYAGRASREHGAAFADIERGSKPAVPPREEPNIEKGDSVEYGGVLGVVTSVRWDDEKKMWLAQAKWEDGNSDRWDAFVLAKSKV